MKINKYLTIGLLFVCFSAWAATSTPVQMLTVEPQSHLTQLYFRGVLSPIKQESVVSPVNGTVATMLVHYGDTVKKGQTLILLNAPELENDYHASLSDYLKAKDAYKIAQTKFNAQNSLWKLGILSKNELMSARSDMASARIAYNQTKISLQELLEKLPASKRINLEKLSLNDFSSVDRSMKMDFSKLPIQCNSAGMVLMSEGHGSDDQKLRVGKEVKAGDVLILTGDLSGVSLTVQVNEMDISKIQPHQKVDITATAFPDMHLQGEVVHIDTQAQRASKESPPQFEVKIEAPTLSSTDRLHIYAGMSAMAAIQIRHDHVFSVPVSAVHEKNGKSFVKVFRNAEIQWAPVHVKETTVRDALITQGLDTNEKIVIS